MRGEILGLERRRRWSDDEKLAIVLSVGVDGATVTQVGLGLDFMSYRGDDYEAGRDFFPNLSDRMHLAAVLAKCGAFMARCEQVVKHVLDPDVPKMELNLCWPQRAHEEVERHEINLGLVASQPEHSLADKHGLEVDLEDGIEKERSLGIGRDTVYSI